VVREEPYVEAPEETVYPVCVGEEGQLTIVQPEELDQLELAQVIVVALPV